MKADLSRDSYRREKHYASVRQQQGRVQLDADWNEQVDIEAHLRQALGMDVVGLTGAPVAENSAGVNFEITPAADSLTIAPGHFYVDGILCENDALLDANAQPDMPRTVNQRFVVVRDNNLDTFTSLPLPAGGQYLAYLDAWPRHITGIEDPEILEPALLGPDTATRAKTVWQVKLLKLAGGNNCRDILDTAAWHNLLRDDAANGPATLAAQAEAQTSSDNPCIVPPRAGYRRLENQLYRVEIHRVTAAGASFKWSRENGSVVTKWLSQDPNNKKVLKVQSIGRDKNLGFSSGQWVELTDRRRELLGEPGTLVQVVSAADDEIQVDEATATGTIDFNADFDTSEAKVRRWDMDAAADVKINHGITATLSTNANEVWIPLEDGIKVKFLAGTFRVGDYWLIPARTNGGDVQWPLDGNKPKPLPPHGIRHHYSALALLQTGASGAFSRLSDCRREFPPATELTSFNYLSGDGQQVMPNPNSPNTPAPLPEPLKVGICNGQWPVTGARVQFTSLTGGGGVVAPTVAVSHAGVAECNWSLASNPALPVQQVQARLLDAANNPTPHPPIIFTASLSVASRVAYPPKCKFQAGDVTVENALDTLATLPRLHKLGGDGQDAEPNVPLELPIRALITSDCGPLGDAQVTFETKGGKVAQQKSNVTNGTDTLTVGTDSKGVASCFWMLDPNGPSTQRLSATLTQPLAKVGAQITVDFTGNLNRDAREPGIFVAKVATGVGALENDQVISVDRLTRGIVVTCESNQNIPFSIVPISVNRATCFVQIERPPDRLEEVSGGTVRPGYSVFVLRADAQVKGKQIFWVPQKLVLAWLKKWLPVWLEGEEGEERRILARFTLKGNFIFTATDPVMYLDGEVFGIRKNALDPKRRGDGRRGGDFEMWFWIGP